MESETSIEENENFLQWPDWLVIAIMLGASAGIGIYYRFTGGKQKTSEEYFSADRSTSITLLSISMMVSFLSGSSLLGISSENYTYGAQFNLIYIGLILGTPIAAYFYLPVFYELQTMSVFEYLEKRFGMIARLVASFANFIQFLFFTGVVIYAPSLALEATTGVDGTISILLIGIICTFYSTIGGIKAVIITDLLQGALMFACIFAIIGNAFMNIDGGFGKIFEIAEQGGRMNLFLIEFDPTVRYSLTATIASTCLFLTQFAVNQVQVQRLLTAKTLRDARKAFFINVPLTLSLTSLVSFSGLALYAYYSTCDPVKAGKIKSYDMIMPYFAKERLTKYSGLAGLFISGIFSASLSTISALLNSLAAVALSDYLKPLFRRYGHDIPDDKAVYYGKLLALSIGGFSLAVAFLAARIGSLVQMVGSIHGAIGGPILGLFTLGMFFESANEPGAVIGTIVALIINMWTAFTPKRRPPILSMSVEQCQNSSLIYSQNTFDIPDENSFSYIDRLSFLWYTMIGMSCTLIVGFIVSIIINNMSGKSPPPIESNLFTPFVAARIRRRREQIAAMNSQVFVLDPKNSLKTN